MKTLKEYDKFIGCILSKCKIKTSWKVIVLDKSEWEIYLNERTKLEQYIEEYIEPIIDRKIDIFKEWDYIDPEEHMVLAMCEQSKKMKIGIESIEMEIKDHSVKEDFVKQTSFLRKVLTSSDSRYIILINQTEYSGLMLFEIPTLFAHETIHIIELCKGKRHKGTWIEEREWDCAKKCIDNVGKSVRDHFSTFKLENNTIIELQ